MILLRVPESILTVTYPAALESPACGVVQFVGIDIFKVPYEGESSHAVFPLVYVITIVLLLPAITTVGLIIAEPGPINGVFVGVNVGVKVGVGSFTLMLGGTNIGNGLLPSGAV